MSPWQAAPAHENEHAAEPGRSGGEMFAGSETEAEDLLCQIRDATPVGEE